MRFWASLNVPSVWISCCCAARRASRAAAVALSSATLAWITLVSRCSWLKIGYDMEKEMFLEFGLPPWPRSQRLPASKPCEDWLTPYEPLTESVGQYGALEALRLAVAAARDACA